MKKKLTIIIIIIFILFLVGMTIYRRDNLRFKIIYELYNNTEYSNGKKIKVNIPINNTVKYLEKKDILYYLNNKKGIMYFGYTSCPWCRNIVPILTRITKELDVPLYYVDIKKDLSSIKKELYEKLDEYLSINDENKKGLGVPLVISFDNGKIISGHKGTVSSYKNPYKGMNDKQKKELENIYKNMIKEVK